MKDFSFAKKFCYLRKDQGLSQKDLAKILGVTNKAISKWENGDAYPSIKQLLSISSIFNVSLDELLKEKKNKEKQVFKIVLTGGPCAGKSSAMKLVKEKFSALGYYVLFIPETASEMIIGGLAPWVISPYEDFQFNLMKLQLEKEEIFESLAKKIDNYDKILIVCDRGIMDAKAYMTKAEFDRSIQKLGRSEIRLRDGYDAVFHLVTAAIGAEEHYGYDNEARYESIEEAVKIDTQILNSWTGHPHLRVIDNSTSFDEKLKRLINEIENFVSQPYEIERKFLIEMPNIEMLKSMDNCKKVEIIQTYLNSSDESEVRIRQRGENGVFTYTKTIKKKVSDLKRIETETKLTNDEYLQLLLDADTTKNQIRKTRYCLVYKNQYFEIDIFPFWKDKAIMEIELNREDQEIEIPKMIKIIKEVTDDERYFNASLAKLNKEKKDTFE